MSTRNWSRSRCSRTSLSKLLAMQFRGPALCYLESLRLRITFLASSAVPIVSAKRISIHGACMF